MVDSAEEIMEKCDIIVVNTKEKEFVNILNTPTDKVIIDFVRLNEQVRNYPNYSGINW